VLKAQIIGNLGSDPEMRYASSGQPLLRMNVASNYRVRGDDGEWMDKTEWVRVTVFGQRAETLAQYLKKGQRVYVDGRLEARPWTDREGGIRAGLEVTANDVEFLTPREDAGTTAVRPQPAVAGVQRGMPAASAMYEDPADDDELENLPF
jgi:single-strand DNA-binding protein